jgi:GT2 family glycosyltransferase
MEPLDVAVVVITQNRRARLLATLDRLCGLEERPHVVVVDNGSRDGTPQAVAAAFPRVELIALERNIGAAARNVGVSATRSPFVAFADDDTWWESGSVRRAAAVLDRYPVAGVVNARIVVEPDGDEDPICAELAHSPVPSPAAGLPALVSFLAGASIVRREAFTAAGGFSPRLLIGGEEELLAADLLSAGWAIVYCDEAVVHHAPSPHRDPDLRRLQGIRNTLWFTWLRRPLASALVRTGRILGSVPWDMVTARALAQAARGTPWVLRSRRVVPDVVEAQYRLIDRGQFRSEARRYVS